MRTSPPLRRGPRLIRPRLVLVVGFVFFAALAPAGAAYASKTPGGLGLGCEPYPGSTTISWHPKDHVASLEFLWFAIRADDTEYLVYHLFVFTKSSTGIYSTPTPATPLDAVGNLFWNVHGSDKKGIETISWGSFGPCEIESITEPVSLRFLHGAGDPAPGNGG